MVSVHPNPPPGQGFTNLYGYHFSGGDPMSSNPGMKRAENGSFLQTPPYWSAGAAVEDPGKKVRKPYTITKSRESWSEQEHDKFLEALHLFDRDWKKIEAFVGSKTVIQIRSHAQKYFMKVQKNGTSEHVPPPRPKRKAAHPYPHKAPKNVASQPAGALSSAALLDSKYAVRPQSMSIPRDIVGSAPLYSWTYNGVPTGCVSPTSRDDFALSDGTMTHNWSSNSNEIAPSIWTSNETYPRVKQNMKEKRANYIRKESIRYMPEELFWDLAMPDFAQVYSFIGSLFDPSSSDHLEKLKKMDPMNIETVLMLVKNLSVNLVGPEFENHRRLLSSYNVGMENDSMGSEASA